MSVQKYSEQEFYGLYGAFLKKYQNFYNIFFLDQLFDATKNHELIDAVQIREKWRQKLHSLQGKGDGITDSMNFYIHVPFCQSKCRFCMYHSVIRHPQGGEVKQYLAHIIKQMRFFKNTFKTSHFNSLYIGGGTPSIFTEYEIQTLLDSLFKNFRFKLNSGDITYECNPRSTNLRKLQIIKKFGFNRVSFGVESLNKKVLACANRGYQDFKHVEKTIKDAQSCGLEVNVDIMTGLDGESTKSIINSFLLLAKLKPYSISLYPHKPSEKYLGGRDYYIYNNKLLKDMTKIKNHLIKTGANENYFIDKECDKGTEIVSLFEMTFYYGKNVPGSLYRYDFNRLEPSSLFALGPCSCSTLFNSLRYKELPGKSFKTDFNPNKKIYSAVNFSLLNEMQYFILHKLSCRYSFAPKEFDNYFKFYKMDCMNVFKNQFASLKKLKKIKFKKGEVILSDHPIERYKTALFFLDQENNVKKIKYFLSKNYLQIRIENKIFLIQIETPKKNKKYYFSCGDFAFYFLKPKNNQKLSKEESCFFQGFCLLFKLVASNKTYKTPEMARDVLLRKLSDILKFKKLNLQDPMFKTNVSIEKPGFKSEKYLF